MKDIDFVETATKLIAYLAEEEKHYEACTKEEKKNHIWLEVQKLQRMVEEHEAK